MMLKLKSLVLSSSCFPFIFFCISMLKYKLVFKLKVGVYEACYLICSVEERCLFFLRLVT